jgi:hypothetical protein
MKIVVKRWRTFAPEVRTINKCYLLVSSVVYLLLHFWEFLAEFLVCLWFLLRHNLTANDHSASLSWWLAPFRAYDKIFV